MVRSLRSPFAGARLGDSPRRKRLLVVAIFLIAIPAISANAQGRHGPVVQPAPPASRYGTLSLGVQPGDANVLVDGESFLSGRGPQSPFSVQLGEGHHHLQVEKAGFDTFSVDIDVRAGETTSLNVSLEPVSKPPTRVARIFSCPPRRAVSRDRCLSARGRARNNRRQDPPNEVLKPLRLHIRPLAVVVPLDTVEELLKPMGGTGEECSRS